MLAYTQTSLELNLNVYSHTVFLLVNILYRQNLLVFILHSITLHMAFPETGVLSAINFAKV